MPSRLHRGVYQRAVVVPTEALGGLWQAYEAFENSSGNRQLAQRGLAELRPQYLAATAVTEARLKLAKGLQAADMAIPPGEGAGESMISTCHQLQTAIHSSCTTGHT